MKEITFLNTLNKGKNWFRSPFTSKIAYLHKNLRVKGAENRQWVSVTSLRNRQSVSVTRISLSLALLRRLDCLFPKPVTETDCLYLKHVTETHCLFLRPVTKTNCLFFSTIYSDNFKKIGLFRGKGGQKWNFYLEYSVQEGYLFHILSISSI